MPLFETKLSPTKYIMLILGVFFIPILVIAFYFIEGINSIFIAIFFFLFGMAYFTFILNSFQVYNNCFVVKRPLIFWEREKIFYNKDIKKIRFWQSSSKIGGGYYLGVETHNSVESFMIINSTQTLKALISAIHKVGIETDIKIKLE